MLNYFSICDFKKAISLIEKNHPFLPDRQWLTEDLDKKLDETCNQINQKGWVFESLELYFEWGKKAIPAVKMSTADWLIHFVLLEKLTQVLCPYFIPHTAYQMSKMDALIGQAKTWKYQQPGTWIIQADIKSFFSRIQEDLLIEKIQQSIPEENKLLTVLSQYLHAIKQAKVKLKATLPTLATASPLLAGLPVGAELNYLLASTYLHAFDNSIFQSKAVTHYSRYIDDILIFVKKKEDVKTVLNLLEGKLNDLGLQLNVNKTNWQNSSFPIQFLRQQI